MTVDLSGLDAANKKLQADPKAAATTKRFAAAAATAIHDMSTFLRSSNNTPTLAPPYVPAPPGSYNPSGTVTATQLESAMGGAGSGLGQATFHPNWQHVTQVPSGDIFVTYNYYDGNAIAEHTTTHFRVKWSSDHGATFTTIYDSNVAGQVELDYGMGPHIESDASGNVYVIVNHYPRGGSSQQTSVTKIHKFAAPYNQAYTSVGTTIGSISQSSNKWSCYFDQTRQWIWICYWQDSTAPNLYAVDLNATVKYSKNIFNVKPGVELYGTATYPCLALKNDGTLFVGWSSESSELISPNLTQGYYDARVMHSLDAGATFIGPNGTIALPVYADDSTATANKLAYHLTHDGVDFLNGADPNYGSGVGQHYNWNHLNHMLYNNGKLHVCYESESSDAHIFGGTRMTYARFDWATKTIDFRLEPAINSDAGDAGNGGVSYHLNPGNSGGSFVTDTSQTGRLYIVGQGRADQGNLGKISLLKIDNPAAATPNLLLYAKQAVTIGTANGLVNICPHRNVQSDGGIIGVCEQADSPFAIYFWRAI